MGWLLIIELVNLRCHLVNLQKLLKEGELLKYSRKEKQPRMFFLVSAKGCVVNSFESRAVGSY